MCMTRYGESGNIAVTVMTFAVTIFNGKISNLWTANMYVAEKLWSLC